MSPSSSSILAQRRDPFRAEAIAARLVAKGFTAVMAQRRDPPDALDYFPTPLWSTRALFRHVLPAVGVDVIGSVWEPACGEGHMAAVIVEFACTIRVHVIF